MREEGEQDTDREGFAALIEGDYDYSQPQRAEVLEATIVEISDDDIVVDLGMKRDGIIPRNDLRLVDEDYLATLKVGDRVPVVVLRSQGPTEEVLVSLNKGLGQGDWLRAQKMLETEEIVEAEVIDHNRGGLVVAFGRLRGFIPNSHLSSLPTGLSRERLAEKKPELVGRTLRLVLIEADQKQRRLVLSEKAAQRRQRQGILDSLSEGDVVTGIVSSFVGYGAFVDLGGVDGLVHISELDWKFVSHPRDVLRIGEEVEVTVLSIDRERQRVGLSRKRALPDPWETVIAGLREGDVIRGVVTHSAPFGLFVEIGEGVEGLVHSTQIPEDLVPAGTDPSGWKVSLRVLRIDQRRRRVALKLVDVIEVPEEAETSEQDVAPAAGEIDTSPVAVTTVEEEAIPTAEEMETSQQGVATADQEVAPAAEAPPADQEVLLAEEIDTSPVAVTTVEEEAIPTAEEMETTQQEVATADQEVAPAAELPPADQEARPASGEATDVEQPPPAASEAAIGAGERLLEASEESKTADHRLLEASEDGMLGEDRLLAAPEEAAEPDSEAAPADLGEQLDAEEEPSASDADPGMPDDQLDP